MAKLRHVAIATPDPEGSARFYEEAFGFERVGVLRDHPLGEGVFLSDGTLNIALIKFSTDQTGHGLDFVGAHHVGILVDDAEAAVAAVERLGARRIEENETSGEAQFEQKFRAPDGTVFDIARHPWAGAARTDSRE